MTRDQAEEILAIAATDCREAIVSLRSAAEQSRKDAEDIMDAWKEWDTSYLHGVGVLTKKFAAQVDDAIGVLSE